MQKHTVRNIIVAIILVMGLIYVYPTLGWLTLSEEAQAARLEKWRQEDSVYQELSPLASAKKTIVRWAEFDRKRVVNLGLDLQGGIHIVLGLEMDKLDPERRAEYVAEGYVTDEAIRQQIQQIALQRVQRRVGEFEAQEPIIQALGSSQIQVQLPGEKDLQRARDLVTKTAFLTFNLVVGAEESEQVFEKIEQAYTGRFLPFCKRSGQRGVLQVSFDNSERVREVVKEAEAAGNVFPENRTILFGAKPRPTEKQFYDIYVIEKSPLITGQGLRSASARPDQQSGSGSWQITFENDAESAPKFGKATEANRQKAMAIVVDSVVVSAPTIQAKITEHGSITGNFSREEAQDLAIALKSGSMPVPVREDYVGVVSPSLGRESIDAGILSSVLGVIAVCCFVVFYYHVAGLIANIALVLNALLLLALLSYVHATLTLPGIAGLMLTLGMAVDANVLIYERIREEVRLGKSLAAAVESGFSRASSAIIDSNVTTLIAAAVLMEFGSGPIEGFAVTLSLGIFTSVFTAMVCSKVMFDFLIGRKMLSRLTMFSFFKEQSKFPFLEWRKIAVGASVVVIVFGLGYFFTRGSEMYGVDFRTGTNLTVKLDTKDAVSPESVRTALASANFSSPMVQGLNEKTEANRFLLRLEEVDESISAEQQAAEGATQNSVATKVQSALAALCGPSATTTNVELQSVQTVGPSVSNQLKIDTLLAVLYSLVFVSLYMWYRFDWRFSIGALAATIHDVCFLLGVLALFRFEFSLNVVAGILTIIGYSLNDTIVVFDRIREDLRLYRGRGYTLIQIMDISINQTLSRTILTSVCTLFVCIVLFFYGGPVLRDFSFVLIAGILIGTYSSIFIASPVALWLQNIEFKRKGGGPKDDTPESRPGAGRRLRRRSSVNRGEIAEPIA
jgi:SecD/SecF fusion protein